MELYLLRHAIAVDRETGGYKNDCERPLTSQGRYKMKRIAQGMQILKLSFDTILSSPYIRAKETAAIVTEVLKIKTDSILLTKNLIPDASFEPLIKEINNHLPSSQNILLVGHQPHLSGLVSYLLAGESSISIDFKKGGLCCLSTEKLSKGSCTLNWLLTPSLLQMLH